MVFVDHHEQRSLGGWELRNSVRCIIKKPFATLKGAALEIDEGWLPNAEDKGFNSKAEIGEDRINLKERWKTKKQAQKYTRTEGFAFLE